VRGARGKGQLESGGGAVKTTAQIYAKKQKTKQPRKKKQIKKGKGARREARSFGYYKRKNQKNGGKRKSRKKDCKEEAEENSL